MPSLVLFGQPTLSAGDDLKVYSISGILFRITQLVMSLFALALFDKQDHSHWKDVRIWCFYDVDEGGNFVDPGLNWVKRNAGPNFWTYFGLSIGLAVGCLAWHVSTFVYTGRGTPTWTKPRERPLKRLCYFNLIGFNFLRVATCAWGTITMYLLDQYCYCTRPQLDAYSASDGDGVSAAGFGGLGTSDLKNNCGDNYGAFFAFTVGLYITHCMDLAVVGITALYFFCKCVSPTKIISDILFINRERKWKLCCRLCFANLSCLTCCLYGGTEALRGDLSDYAMLMSNIFSHEDYLDVTASDVFAALLMLKRSHLQEEMEAKKQFAERALQKAATQRFQLDGSNQTDVESDDDVVDDEQPHNNTSTMIKATYGTLKKIYASTRDHLTFGLLTTREGIREAEKSCQNWVPGVSLAYVHETKEEEDLDGDEGQQETTVDVDIESEPTTTTEPLQKPTTTTAPLNDQSTRVRNRRSSRWLSPRFRSTLNVQNDNELLVIAEGARFIHHAEAIYFWAAVKAKKTPLLSRMGLRKLQSHADSILLDHARQFTGLAPIPGINPNDVQYIQNRQSLTQTPYVVVVDHAWKSVVVSIRGSVSLEDLLTDLSLSPAELDDHGDLHDFKGKGCYCHRGVLTRAEWIYGDLDENCNLHELLHGEYAIFEGYRLRITGHSLGAAVASLLTLFLRSEFPDVRCLAFSPPGGTVCSKVSALMTTFVTSYILDTDVIGRSSLEGFLGLRDELLEMVARIKIPKSKVLGTGRKEKGRVIPLEEFNRKALRPASEINHNNRYVKKLDHFYEVEKQASKNFPKLYPPGRIIQLFRTINLPQSKSCVCCCNGPEADSRVNQLEDVPYTARWAEREDFGRVILSSHFLSDHETANVKGQLHLLAERAGLHEPFTGALKYDLEVEDV